MTNYSINGVEPDYEDEHSVYVAPGAMVIGKVSIGRDVNIWPQTVVTV